MKKYLLIADIPPCRNFTGGLALAQLCGFMPPGSLACFAIVNPALTPEFIPELDWIPTKIVAKPKESPVDTLTDLGNAMVEAFRHWIVAPRLVAAAAQFAREQRVDAIWAVMEGQTLVRVAGPLAARLQLPLITQVWDPLSWWLRHHRLDAWNSRMVLNRFDETIAKSRACFTASWAMAELFEQRYGVPCTPMILSCDPRKSATDIPVRLRNAHELVIGMAGQFYAEDAWASLVGALDRMEWRIAGRRIRVQVAGPHAPPRRPSFEHVEFLGWKPREALTEYLHHNADILYCPYPFSETWEETAQLSFPSKLPIYMASGRPILFHGPSYAAPAKYLRDRGAAAICTELAPDAVAAQLRQLVESPALYERLVRDAHTALERDLSPGGMRKHFLSVLELSDSDARDGSKKLAGAVPLDQEGAEPRLAVDAAISES